MKQQTTLNIGSNQNNQLSKGPVTCLGLTFENDAARKAHFTEGLRKKLQDPEFRKIEGFPIGEDEDILGLSDPPYYTACPNPWAAEIITEWEIQKSEQTGDYTYHKEPFAADVSESKTHPIYRAHSYHTKVPHLAIVPYMLHYTEPGDIVLDGFSGSGMTGIAAQWCGSPPQYYRAEIEQKWKARGHTPPRWGLRHCVLNDLSPAATFMAANFNLPFDVDAFSTAAKKLLADAEEQTGWMYETLHTDGKTMCRIEYTVWSEVFTCPDCAGEVIFLNEALDNVSKKVADEFPCPHCNTILNKRKLERYFQTVADKKLADNWKHITFRPVLISYKIGKQRYKKQPDAQDLDTIKKIEDMPLPEGIPPNRFPVEEMYHGSRIAPKGYTHIHHFYFPRAAQALGILWRLATVHSDDRIRHMLMFFIEQGFSTLSILNRFRPNQTSQSNQVMTGVYYIPSQIAENSIAYRYESKLKTLVKTFQSQYADISGTVTGTGSTTSLQIPNQSIDYIFTDPPFGENIFYADLNFLVESWYGVLSNTNAEAIIDKFKGKRLFEYQELMRRCFAEYYRVLKPGRWITVVFHNSRNAVWNAIQEALQAVGFVVADVRTLDKQQGSYRQVTSTATKQDLVIAAYKVDGDVENRFKLRADTEDSVWEFVRMHLNNIPVFVNKDGKSEVIAERKEYLLFDRMVAFYVQRGLAVPLSSSDFFAGLSQRFSERDTMYFLPNQAAEYDKKRMAVQGVEQLTLFVSDEVSARQWLRDQIRYKPQTFQEIHPQFIKEIGGWNKAEIPLELSMLLEQNFLCYDGKGLVPEQIHSYLSTNWKDMRNLPKNAPALVAKAKHRWYIPDPTKSGDLEKLRERALLKEFEAYKQSKKKLKIFRLEAVRAGFKAAWQNRDYSTIIGVTEKIPNKVLEEDPKLLMWYDQAVTRMGGE